MAENKKSVLLYCDIIHTVEELDDVDAGLLFKHYLRYINDQNPDPPSKLIKIVFEPIKQNLKRDLKKWEQKSIKNSESARIRWNKENANACERIERNAKHADKDTVTVNVTDKVNDTDTDIFKSETKKVLNDSGLIINQELSEWEKWGTKIVNQEDQYWEQMKGRKISAEEMDNFISVASRNSWAMETQQKFRMALKGFKSINQNNSNGKQNTRSAEVITNQPRSSTW